MQLKRELNWNGDIILCTDADCEMGVFGYKR